MTDLTLYHNPRCSKYRGALELLEARGLAPTVVRYLETPLDATQLKALLAKLGVSARQLLRTGEDEYKALNLADASLTEAQLIAAIAAHPKLMERPILETADKAIIGRPSYGNVYSALNAVSGHYNNFGTKYPLPQKRKDRVMDEFKTAEIALSRGR